MLTPYINLRGFNGAKEAEIILQMRQENIFAALLQETHASELGMPLHRAWTLGEGVPLRLSGRDRCPESGRS